MRRNLLRSPAFARDLKAWLKSHPGTAADVQTTLDQLSADAAHPSLRTHKLRGELSDCWACSAGPARTLRGLRKMGTYRETVGNPSVFQRKPHLLVNYSFHMGHY